MYAPPIDIDDLERGYDATMICIWEMQLFRHALLRYTIWMRAMTAE
jgi:hypothetical protein